MSNCTAITAFFPSIVSKSIFAPRRADKSIEAESTPVTILNAGVAALQLSKLGEGVVAIAKDKEPAVKAAASNVMCNISKPSGSIFSDINKVTNKITKYISINDAIGVATLAHALSQDDKESALIQDGGMYGGMLLSEGAHKLLFGSSNSSYVGGVQNIDVKEGLYRKNKYLKSVADRFVAFCEKQEEALKDCGEVKRTIGKMVKYVPSGIKGFSFALTSIGGSAFFYWLFGRLAEKITGRQAT